MIRSARVDCELRRVMPATLEAIEDFLIEFHVRFAATQNWVDSFTTELLVREALTNAVMHGCGANPAMQVNCLLRLRGRSLLIAVSDEGDGFDWRAAFHREGEVVDCSGRGISILRAYADRVRYNARGNTVVLVKRFR